MLVSVISICLIIQCFSLHVTEHSCGRKSAAPADDSSWIFSNGNDERWVDLPSPPWSCTLGLTSMIQRSHVGSLETVQPMLGRAPGKSWQDDICNTCSFDVIGNNGPAGHRSSTSIFSTQQFSFSGLRMAIILPSSTPPQPVVILCEPGRLCVLQGQLWNPLFDPVVASVAIDDENWALSLGVHCYGESFCIQEIWVTSILLVMICLSANCDMDFVVLKAWMVTPSKG